MAGKSAVLARLGLLLFVALALAGQARAQRYLPDGPNVPLVTLNEDQRGAAGLPPLNVPPPNGWDQESIWNMRIVGFNDNQGRASSDDGWIENQNGRYILYAADSPGTAYNPLTRQVEPNGTSLIDVTDPAHPIFLHHIPAPSGGGSTHVAVCGSDTLHNTTGSHWYLLRHDGSTDQEVWDVTDPTNPVQIATIIGNLTANHHDWWECDTGIAYVIAQTATDGWHETGSKQHVYIYDLSNPANPKFIRQFGLVGQQPVHLPLPGGATATASGIGAPTAPAAASVPAVPSAAASTGTTCPGRPATTRYVALVGHNTAADTAELVLRPGHYVCGDPSNPDAATFVQTGAPETLPIRDDARITATTPVTSNTTSQSITTGRLIDWVSTHPGVLAVFTYQTNQQGQITKLDEIYNG